MGERRTLPDHVLYLAERRTLPLTDTCLFIYGSSSATHCKVPPVFSVGGLSMDGSRTPRRRGRRSLWTLISQLEPWARDVYNSLKVIESPRLLRIALRNLRDLITILEDRLQTLEANEANQHWDHA